MAVHRILLVDDDVDILAVVGETIRDKFEVIQAVDGLDALHHLETGEPDLAVIDYEMPLMDGFELCRVIRKHERFRAMPVIFLSGHAAKAEITKGYKSGANLYLTKPIDPLRILKNIEFTIEHEKIEVREKQYTIEELRDLRERDGEDATPPLSRLSPSDPARSSATAKPKTAHADPIQVTPELVSDEELELQFVEPDYEDSQSSRASDKAASGPVRVMAVENEDDARELLGAILAQADYEVITAVDGLAAVERVVKYQPDLVLVDLMMPRMNGFQFLKSLRQNIAYRNLPIIVVTAKASRRDRDYVMKLGATAFIAKPYESEELLADVAEIVNRADFVVAAKRLSIEEIRYAEKLEAAEKRDDKKLDTREDRHAELQRLANEDGPASGHGDHSGHDDH